MNSVNEQFKIYDDVFWHDPDNLISGVGRVMQHNGDVYRVEMASDIIIHAERAELTKINGGECVGVDSAGSFLYMDTLYRRVAARKTHYRSPDGAFSEEELRRITATRQQHQIDIAADAMAAAESSKQDEVGWSNEAIVVMSPAVETPITKITIVEDTDGIIRINGRSVAAWMGEFNVKAGRMVYFDAFKPTGAFKRVCGFGLLLCIAYGDGDAARAYAATRNNSKIAWYEIIKEAGLLRTQSHAFEAGWCAWVPNGLDPEYYRLGKLAYEQCGSTYIS